MDREIKGTTQKGHDLGDPARPGLMLSVSEYLSGLSAGNRIDRRKRKIRARLVREYIHNDTLPPSSRGGVLGKLINAF